MAWTQRPARADLPTPDPTPLRRGFGYLTLDPGPRLRRLRDQQLAADPAATIRSAWSPVEQAIEKALRDAPPSR
jgi:hypothetical protein